MAIPAKPIRPKKVVVKESRAERNPSAKPIVSYAHKQAKRGTQSLPFDLGKHKRSAVKIIDDRGIAYLKVMEVEK